MRSRLVKLCATACFFAVLVGAQTNPAKSTDLEPRLTFEVASIKLNTSVNSNMSINRAPGGQLNCTNVSLRMLLQMAYDLRDYQLQNLPAWANTEHYDIFAKPSAEAGAREPSDISGMPHLRQRTQALLADRFGLILHSEEKELPVYALVVAKGGPKLTAAQNPTDSFGPQISFNDRRVACKNVTMQRFAQAVLSSRMSHDVVDKTGLTGVYDFEMHFVPDEGPTKETGDRASTDLAGPSFLSALQEQLGLRLETSKAPVKIWVVDRVDRSTPN
jgi:uncharacterized protein (TIGR03435 family)